MSIDTSIRSSALANLVEVPVARLRVGMFVAQLDRPWIDTPFVFQGFHIRSPREIRQLTKYCEYVYVDYARHTSSAPRVPARARGLAAMLKVTRLGSFMRGGLRAEKSAAPADRYPERREVKAELPQAMRSHSDAERAVAEVMDDLQSGGKLHTAQMIDVINPMIDSVLRNKDALAALMRMKRKDNYTYAHALASAVWATVFGRHLGLERDMLEELALASLLLDVGKTRIPSELLVKPGTLEAAERSLLRRHVEFGLEIIDRAEGVNSAVLAAVGAHHERHDGSGYPHGLDGPAIPLLARIAGIVDAYDAMITPRPYATPLSSYDAMRELVDGADVHFQSEMVEQFMQAIGMFPTGSLVELNTGEVGVVVGQNTTRRLRPRIMLVLDENKRRRPEAPVVDLLRIEQDDTTRNLIWITHGLEPGAYGVSPAEFYL